MNYKYFRITDQETINYIDECIESRATRESALSDLAKQFGALECLVFSGGSIAAFKFDYSVRPDKLIWKKVKHGFMPKVKTSENKQLLAVPSAIDYRDIIKKYGFGGEMIIGDASPSGHGFKMHSSYLRGNQKNKFWVIVVPYQQEFDRDVDANLVELKEWEVVKGCDSSDS